MQRQISESWIPATIAWQSDSSIVGILTRIDDPDLVEFIAKAKREILINPPKKLSLCLADMRLCGDCRLESGLLRAAWDKRLLKTFGTRYKSNSKIVVFFRGLFRLSDNETILVLVSASSPPRNRSNSDNKLQDAAAKLVEKHKLTIEAFEKELEEKKLAKEKDRERYASNPAQLEAFEKASIIFSESLYPPKLLCYPILDLMPRAVLCRHSPNMTQESLNKRALDAMIKSGLGAPRDGVFWGVRSLRIESEIVSLVSWSAHTGMLPYPEVRWAVQRGLPSAVAKPRTDGLGSPRKFPTDPTQNIDAIEGFPIDSDEFDATFDDFQLDDVDYRDRVDGAKRSLSESGFEAFAWFQPYHRWTEGSWGIYFDAKKLDDLALSIFEDLRQSSVGGNLQKISALLAFGLTYSHEMFHAKVEAAASWNELGARRGQYLPYTKNVYAALIGTDGCLEEALANWSAWSWFSKLLEGGRFNSFGSSELISQVVKTNLDLSPPGYRKWRIGSEVNSWREFCHQLSTGKVVAKGSKPSLPLEGILTATPPYDLQDTDVPLRFVGRGNIVDRILSHPANFNVPTRRELEKALRYFKHFLDPSGGKGGHQKWTGPDQKAFILPTRDPVSRVVFKSFLQHLGIDKNTYVLQIRPQL